MSYCFRIEFRGGERVHLATTAEELELANDGEGGERVVLRPSEEGVEFGDAEWLSLRGQSYLTPDDAEHAAARWANRLRLAFSVLRLGADFGLRAPGGFVTEHGLKMVEDASGKRALNDVHGITVFECEPPPVFVRISGKAKVGKPVDRFLDLLAAAATAGVAMIVSAVSRYSRRCLRSSRRSATWVDLRTSAGC